MQVQSVIVLAAISVKPGDCLDQQRSSKETLIRVTITQYLLKVMKKLEIMKRKVYESLGPTCINLAQRNPKLIY